MHPALADKTHSRLFKAPVAELRSVLAPLPAARIDFFTASQLSGLRNRLIHEYDNVDFDILWQILTGIPYRATGQPVDIAMVPAEGWP